MRIPQLPAFAAFALFTFPAASPAAPPTPYEQAMAPYRAELDRQCPGRRLEDLTAGDLELIMEGFEERLPKAEQADLAAEVEEACARTIAGLGCANTAAIRHFARAKRLAAFVGEVCASRWRCAAPAECVETAR